MSKNKIGSTIYFSSCIFLLSILIALDLINLLISDFEISLLINEIQSDWLQLLRKKGPVEQFDIEDRGDSFVVIKDGKIVKRFDTFGNLEVGRISNDEVRTFTIKYTFKKGTEYICLINGKKFILEKI